MANPVSQYHTFRLTQFVSNMTPSDLTSGPNISIKKRLAPSTNDSGVPIASQPPTIPASPPHNPPTHQSALHLELPPNSGRRAKPARRTATPPLDTASLQKAGQNGFNVMDIQKGRLVTADSTSARSLEGVLGPNYDKRVRDPVPSILKGKNDLSKGSFNVMHMDSPRRDKGAPLRNSLGTVAAAEAWRLTRKRKLEDPTIVDNFQSTSSAPASLPNSNAVLQTQKPLGLQPPADVPKPINPNEATKAERERLLKLIQTLQPEQVVIQVCNALTYFGGIPGGGFPDSAEANGSGEKFIRWISEIFPEVKDEASKQRFLKKSTPKQAYVSTGRPRGRPVGSVSKPRIAGNDGKAKKKVPKNAERKAPGGAKRGRKPGSRNLTIQSQPQRSVDEDDAGWEGEVHDEDGSGEEDVSPYHIFCNFGSGGIGDSVG
ncbi:MAG: hypothetical protein M1829_005772 [Trizodia sp. TS-e1964]|nr:MAG: hypothetical protein M1829_005772 [Trizodia sp. TS-e1964]